MQKLQSAQDQRRESFTFNRTNEKSKLPIVVNFQEGVTRYYIGSGEHYTMGKEVGFITITEIVDTRDQLTFFKGFEEHFGVRVDITGTFEQKSWFHANFYVFNFNYKKQESSN